MPPKRLPRKLMKPPVVDAVFEIRFQSSAPASSILPGLLFAQIDEEPKRIEKLPVSEIPTQIRSMDAGLKFQPLLRLSWGNFFVLIGDSSLAITCKMPYPGWNKFSVQIIKIMKIAAATEIINSVKRYSIKYTNIIGEGKIGEDIRGVDMSIRVGNYTVNSEIFALRIEIPRDQFLHLVQIAAHGRVRLHNGETKEGSVVEVDTLCNYETDDFVTFVDQLPTRIDVLHTEAKTMFFECLTSDAINSMEPTYE